MKNTFSLLLFVALLGVLFLTNPTQEDFKDFARERSEEALMQETGGGAFGELLADLGSSVVGSAAGRVSERNNYALFSTYTIDLGGDDREGDQWRFLGIAGQFIELEKPNSDDDSG